MNIALKDAYVSTWMVARIGEYMCGIDVAHQVAHLCDIQWLKIQCSMYDILGWRWVIFALIQGISATNDQKFGHQRKTLIFYI